jgi:predicted TPR repeat methyltransferase
VPELLAAAVAAATPDQLMDVLDLGCGTGLCGALLRPMAGTLRGVDLSPAMIAKARERGVYDELEVGDLIESLRRRPKTCDLLTAADVLNYVGDLAPVLDAATLALRPGGLFAFTVEAAASGDRFELVKGTQRYAHARPHVDHVARIYGFEQRSLEPVILRHDAGKPVHGYLAVLALP